MGQHILQMQFHHHMPLGDAGVRTDRPTGKTVTRLRKKPGTALRAATDHHAGRAAFTGGRRHILEGANVAIDHDRNSDRLHRFANRPPVGRSVIHLAARAAMNREETDAGPLRHAGNHGRIKAVMIPSKPHLQRHRHIDGIDNRFKDRPGERFVPHKGRSGKPAGHFLCRTSHVYVDESGAEISRNARRLGHDLRVPSGELHGKRHFTHRIGSKLAHLRFHLSQDCSAGNHFGHHQTAPCPPDRAPERHVRDT